MATITQRNVWAHPARLTLSVSAIALGVAFVVGSFMFREVLATTFERAVATTITADVYLRGRPVNDPDTPVADRPEDVVRDSVDTALVGELTGLSGVRTAFAETFGPVALADADGEVLITGPTSLAAVPELDPTAQLVSGSWPRVAQIALEESTAKHAGLRNGDSTTVVLGENRHDVTVTGQFSVATLAVGTVVVGIDPQTAAQTFAPDGTVQRIAVFATPGTALEAVVDRVAAVAATHGAEAVTGDELRADARADAERALGFIDTFIILFAGMAILAGTFIIANTFAMSVRERTDEFATLRAIGTSPWHILVSVLGHALIVGIIGATVGVFLGAQGAQLIRMIVESMSMSISGETELTVERAVQGIALGTVATLVAAGAPALRAIRIPPVQAMREKAIETTHHRRGIAGLAITMIGAGVLWSAAQLGSTVDPTPTGMTWIDALDPQDILLAGAGFVVVGMLLVAPALDLALLRVLALPFLALKPLGRLARGNVIRNPQRTANTAASLFIGMALVALTGIVAASSRESLRSIVDNEIRADLVVSSVTGTVPVAAMDTVRAAAGVTRLDVQRGATVALVAPAGGPGRAVPASAVSAGALASSLDTTAVSGDPVAALAAGDAVAVRSLARDRGWSVGDHIELHAAHGPVALRLGAVIDSHIVGHGLLLDDESYDALVPEPERRITALYASATSGQVDELHAILTDAVDPFLVLTVRNRDEAASAYAASVDEIIAVLYAVLALSVVIALLGIVNTLTMSVIERTREIGLLRIVGIGSLQLSTVIAVEAVLVAVCGTVVGLAVGIGIGVALPGTLVSQGMTAFALPARDLAWMVAAAMAIGLIASLAPALRACRIPALVALGSD